MTTEEKLIEIGERLHDVTQYSFKVGICYSEDRSISTFFPQELPGQHYWRAKKLGWGFIKKGTLMSANPNLQTLSGVYTFRAKDQYPEGTLRDAETNTLIIIQGDDKETDHAIAYCYLSLFLKREVPGLLETFLPEIRKKIELIKLPLIPAIAS